MDRKGTERNERGTYPSHVHDDVLSRGVEATDFEGEAHEGELVGEGHGSKGVENGHHTSLGGEGGWVGEEKRDRRIVT